MKFGYLFPGQGSQYVGMGKELAAHYKEADDVYNEANEVLEFDLKKIIFEGPESELTLTHNSQPAILVTSLACLAVMKKEGIYAEPAAAAGLSLGEFTALHVAGAFSFPDVLKLVRLRGLFMQEACDEKRGTMASIIGMEEAAVAEICREANKAGLVDIANINCPGQIVVSGNVEGVSKAMELADAGGAGKVVPLNVAGAFHSHLMESARRKLEEVLRVTPIEPPRFPVFLNVSGEATRDPHKIRESLGRQVTSSVLWERCINGMMRLSISHFLEVGCGRVLVGLLKRISKDASYANVEDLKSLEKTKKYIEELKVKG